MLVITVVCVQKRLIVVVCECVCVRESLITSGSVCVYCAVCEGVRV